MKIQRILSKNLTFPRNYPEREVIVNYKTNEKIICKVPENYSNNAANITFQKYCVKHLPNESSEINFEDLFMRLALEFSEDGFEQGYFDTKEDAENFKYEIFYCLEQQIASPNSPQWFNAGLKRFYGITGEAQGHYYFEKDGTIRESPDQYTYRQAAACYIQPIDDSIEGISNLLSSETRLFKQGSGTGTNFSSLRGKNEALANGGTSSGLMSFLEVFDANAGAIKSGGKTRRAAKMVCLDMDHPEIEDFITWKDRCEWKVPYLILGEQILRRWWKEIQKNPDNWKTVISEIPNKTSIKIGKKLRDLAIQKLEPNFTEITEDFEGEGYKTVSGQNSNNSVRVTNEFLQDVEDKYNWSLKNRTNDEETGAWADKLFDDIAKAAWSCADPGIQFEDHIQEMHTCKNDGPIRASNPCSEYMFLDNTACNLASLNLVKLLKEDGSIDWDLFAYIVRLFTILLDLSVSGSQYPTKEIAYNSYLYRTIGLGYANLGLLFLLKGYGYDSESARRLCSKITAFMHAHCALTSIELAKELGVFPAFERNKECLLDVFCKHYNSALKFKDNKIEDLYVEVLCGISKYGIRNAQLTVIAPTGTIGLQMDCESTGGEPIFALFSTKKLAGGGEMVIASESAKRFIQKRYPSSYDHILLDLESGIKIKDTCLTYEDIDILKCANDLSPEAHVKMVAAAQPFISGAISKTINMPESATVKNIKDIYLLAHKLKLKAISVYRKGCKLSEPLNTTEEEIVLPKYYKRGEKEEPPNIANAEVVRAEINGRNVRLIKSYYDDGRLAEIYCPAYKETSEVQSLFTAVGVLISKGLQAGVSAEEYAEALRNFNGVGAGMVHGIKGINTCTSVLDFYSKLLSEKTHIAPKANKKETIEKEPLSILVDSGCPECGSADVIQTGSCKTCRKCGWNGGCG